MLPDLIAGKYKPSLKLASGPFYEVFKAKHKLNEIEIVVKLEKKSLGESKIFTEVKILKQIQGEDLTVDWGVPQVIENGTDGEYNYMVMDVFGPSLDHYLINQKGKMDLKYALELGQQMLDRLQMLHSKGFVHRDIRPEHFLYGRVKRPDRIYISGLNTSKRYIDKSLKHAFYKDNKHSFTGTARYLSLNAHMGIQQSRRDDIESLLYIIIYMIRGILPWQNIKADKRYLKNEKIFESKLVTPIDKVCQGLPMSMQQILLYVKLLEYEQTPDYQFIKKHFKLMKEGRSNDLIFE